MPAKLPKRWRKVHPLRDAFAADRNLRYKRLRNAREYKADRKMEACIRHLRGDAEKSIQMLLTFCRKVCVDIKVSDCQHYRSTGSLFSLPSSLPPWLEAAILSRHRVSTGAIVDTLPEMLRMPLAPLLPYEGAGSPAIRLIGAGILPGDTLRVLFYKVPETVYLHIKRLLYFDDDGPYAYDESSTAELFFGVHAELKEVIYGIKDPSQRGQEVVRAYDEMLRSHQSLLRQRRDNMRKELKDYALCISTYALFPTIPPPRKGVTVYSALIHAEMFHLRRETRYAHYEAEIPECKKTVELTCCYEVYRKDRGVLPACPVCREKVLAFLSETSVKVARVLGLPRVEVPIRMGNKCYHTREEFLYGE